MIYIFSPKKAAALERVLERTLASDKKSAWIEILHHIPAADLIKDGDPRKSIFKNKSIC
jgi:hypothetical protein